MVAWLIIALVSVGLARADGGLLWGPSELSPEFSRPTARVVADSVLKVVAGDNHTLVLRKDGVLLGTGANDRFQLGSGSTVTRANFMPIASNVTDVATYGDASVFLKADGTVWFMGSNSFFGSGAAPLQIGSDADACGAGFSGIWYRKTDKTLWVRGSRMGGNDGIGMPSATPYQSASNVQSVATGWLHTAMVSVDGTLYTAGDNSFGQLGTGTMQYYSVFTPVATGVAKAAASLNNTLYLKNDGTLWGMGSNSDGSLGDGSTTNRTSAVQIASGVADMWMAVGYSFFLKTDGTLWGMGSSARLGLAPGSTVSTPVQVASNVAQASLVNGHSVILKTDGTLWTLGSNRYGQLGQGTRSVDGGLAQIASDVIYTAVGANHTAFIDADARLWAAGRSDRGQLGDGCLAPDSTLLATDAIAASYGNAQAVYASATGALVQLPSRTTIAAAGADAVLQSRDNLYTLYRKPDGTLWRVSGQTSTQLASDVVEFGAGTGFHAYLKTDGTLWGKTDVPNAYVYTPYFGEAGPVLIASDVSSLAVYTNYLLFTKTDSSLWGMGYSGSAWFSGANPAHFINTPVKIEAGNVARAFAYAPHNLVLRTDATLWSRGSSWIPDAVQVADGVSSAAVNEQYSWYIKNDGNGTLMRRRGVSTVESVEYIVAQHVTAVATTGATDKVLFIQAAGTGSAVSINDQPQPLTRGYGGSATFTVAVMGHGPLAYQWYRDGVAIEGAQNAQLYLPFVVEEDAGAYTVAVTNAAGTITSSSAALTVVPGTALISLGTSAVFNGSPQQPTVLTNPAGLPVTLTYNGSSTPPTAPGIYAVVATIADPHYEGSASGNFEIIYEGPVTGALAGDFDGDGHADTLWRNVNTGDISTWPSAGGYLSFGREGGGWTYFDQDDFDGDGKVDTLWRNANTGDISTWPSGGGNRAFGREGGGWSYLGKADFDGDGKVDTLWRNANTGDIVSWVSTGAYTLFGREGGGWVYIDIGDFDGDGQIDTLWRNTNSGEIATWPSAGGYLTFGREDGGWTYFDKDDFDGDGKVDTLWRNANTGDISTWPSTGGYLAFGREGGGWSYIAKDDFDGDGKVDTLWRDANTGHIVTWPSAGTYTIFGREVGGWTFIDTGDFDGDGKADTLWRNTSTGEIASWPSSGGYLSFGFEGGGWTYIAGLD